MTDEQIKERMAELKQFLNRNWEGLSDNFIDRLLARIEYDKLEKQLYGKN